MTTLADTAKPVTDLAFPTVTICAAGLHMDNVKVVLERSFNDWRFENQKSWDNEDIGDLMAEFMEEKFQIQEKGVNILDILNTMIAPSPDASVSSNSVRKNIVACSSGDKNRRKRQSAGNTR